MKRTFTLTRDRVKELMQAKESVVPHLYDEDYWYAQSYSSIAHSRVTVEIVDVASGSRLKRFKAAVTAAYRTYRRVMDQ